MKSLLALLILGFSAFASAEVCTSVIRDRSGYEWETFTRSSYSQSAACDQALYDCRDALAYAQSYGRYYDAQCEIKWNNPYPTPTPNPYPNPYPTPNPSGYICQTDLVDYYGNTVRSFTAPGADPATACMTSDNFCKVELARNNTYGTRCENRGLIGNRNDPRPPSRNRVEQCTVNRLDPAGMFVQAYTEQASGPINSDVKGEACRLALQDCSRDIRGRQTCNIVR